MAIKMSANRIIKAVLLFTSLAGSSAFSPSHSFVGQHRNPLEKKLPHQLQPAVANTFIRKNVDHSATQLNSVMEIIGTSPEPIHTAFTLATLGPQPFWLLLILLPKTDVTKKVMGTMDVVLVFALLHFFIVSGSIVQPGATAPLSEFNEVFDPNGDPQAAFMNMVTNYPNFVAEEWSHVLTWDLFVGRWIWLDGLRRGVFTSHSVLFCNLIGPPGLLIHWVTCLVTGKGFNENEAIEEIQE